MTRTPWTWRALLAHLTALAAGLLIGSAYWIALAVRFR